MDRRYGMMHGRRNRSGRPGSCQTNNLTSKNFYVHIISSFVNSSVARILLQGGDGTDAWRTGSEVRGDKVIQK